MSLESKNYQITEPERSIDKEIAETKAKMARLEQEIQELEQGAMAENSPKSEHLSRKKFIGMGLLAAGSLFIKPESTRIPSATEDIIPIETTSNEEKIKNYIEESIEIIQNEEYEKVLTNPYLVSALYYSEKYLKTLKLDAGGPSEIILGIYPFITGEFREKYLKFLETNTTQRMIAKNPNHEDVFNKKSAPLSQISHGENLEDNHHDAIDLFIEEGSTVYSMTGGVVVLAENGWGEDDKLSTSSFLGGNTVIIFNPHNYSFYRYAHMKETIVPVGALVLSGQQIGIVGNTGLNASKKGQGNHLHLEINEYDKKRKVMLPVDVFELKKRIRATNT